MLLTFFTWFLQGALILVCGFMVLIILMQRSKQEGLGAAFGSGMTDSVFGAQTTNVLAKMTVWCAALFFIITLTLSSIQARSQIKTSPLEKLTKETAPVSTPAPVVPPAVPAEATTTPETPATPATPVAPVE